MTKHLNTGSCDKCKEVIHKYSNFNKELADWFYSFQKNHPEAHLSAAGRGKAEQELYFRQGKSKAHYKQSSHNYNAALDFFRLTLNGADFSPDWYINTLGVEAKKAGFDWAGDWKSFKELVHIELHNFKDLLKDGKLTLVEPD